MAELQTNVAVVLAEGRNRLVEARVERRKARAKKLAERRAKFDERREKLAAKHRSILIDTNKAAQPVVERHICERAILHLKYEYQLEAFEAEQGSLEDQAVSVANLERDSSLTPSSTLDELKRAQATYDEHCARSRRQLRAQATQLRIKLWEAYASQKMALREQHDIEISNVVTQEITLGSQVTLENKYGFKQEYTCVTIRDVTIPGYANREDGTTRMLLLQRQFQGMDVVHIVERWVNLNSHEIEDVGELLAKLGMEQARETGPPPLTAFLTFISRQIYILK